MGLGGCPGSMIRAERAERRGWTRSPGAVGGRQGDAGGEAEGGEPGGCGSWRPREGDISRREWSAGQSAQKKNTPPLSSVQAVTGRPAGSDRRRRRVGGGAVLRWVGAQLSCVSLSGLTSRCRGLWWFFFVAPVHTGTEEMSVRSDTWVNGGARGGQSRFLPG